MDMEILKDDKKKKKKDSKIKINPLYIHISILVIILFSVFLYFSSNFDFTLNKSESEMITIVGDLEKFNEKYDGDINLYSKQFSLNTENAVYNETSKDIKIKNFKGNIQTANQSIIIKGIASEIKYGANTINIANKEFELISFKKTNINLLLSTINLNFEEGRIKISNDLNYDFESSSIILNNFNTTLNYDGKYVFSGLADNLSLSSTKNNIIIEYVAEKNEQINTTSK